MHPLLFLRQQQQEREQAQRVTPPPTWPVVPVTPMTPPGSSFLEDLAMVALAGLAIYGVASTGAALVEAVVGGGDDEPDDLESGDHLVNPSWNYKLLAKGRVVYEGETGRPHLRPIEHLLSGKKFDAVKVDPTPSPKPVARLIEAANLAAHRDKYGRNPKYNRTNHG